MAGRSRRNRNRNRNRSRGDCARYAGPPAIAASPFFAAGGALALGLADAP